eukprot:scaffold95247_cov24-Tisochrysis_lutea.AAC.3
MSPIGYGMSKRPLPQCIKFIRAKDHCHSALSSYEQNHFATDDCLESASMPELAIQAGGQWPTLMLLASCMHAFKQSLNSFGLKPAVLLERQSTPLDWQVLECADTSLQNFVSFTPDSTHPKQKWGRNRTILMTAGSFIIHPGQHQLPKRAMPRFDCPDFQSGRAPD